MIKKEQIGILLPCYQDWYILWACVFYYFGVLYESMHELYERLTKLDSYIIWFFHANEYIMHVELFGLDLMKNGNETQKVIKTF